MTYQVRNYQYQVRVLDGNNDTVAIYTDLLSLSYKKRVNQVGMAILAIPAEHPLLDYAVDDTLIEIYLGYPKKTLAANRLNIEWGSDFLGIYRDQQITTDEFGNVYYLLYFPSTMEILSRYVTGYTTGVDGKSSWVGAELATIANDVVKWNCTSDATVVNGRIRDATVIHDLIDGGSISGTAVVDYSVPPGRNVLEFLQELAPLLGFDFDVRKYPLDLTRLEAHQFTGQLGSDLSNDIVFSLSLDNLANAQLSGDRLREKTVAIVGGQGEGASRAFSVNVGTNYSATNDYETFLNARDKPDDELSDAGDAYIGGLVARRQVGGTIASSLGYVYRRDYGLGDLVSVEFAGALETKKIIAVDVTFEQDQRFSINVEFAEP